MSQYVKYFELLALIAVFINWKNIQPNHFLKWLGVVILVITITDFTGYFLWKNNINNLFYYNLIAIPLQIIFYCWAFFKDNKNTSSKRTIMLLSTTIIIIYTIAAFVINNFKTFNVIGYCSFCIMISIFAIIKINHIINDPIQIDFLKIPLFYLMLTMLVYYLCTLPYYTVSYLMVKNKGLTSTYQYLKYTTAVLNYLLYLSFLINFLWERKKLVYS